MSLTRLDLSGNQLSELPEEMVHSENLKALNLADNKLTDIPWLGQFGKFVEMELFGNSLLSPLDSSIER